MCSIESFSPAVQGTVDHAPHIFNTKSNRATVTPSHTPAHSPTPAANPLPCSLLAEAAFASHNESLDCDEVRVFMICNTYYCEPEQDGRWQTPGRLLLSGEAQPAPVLSPPCFGRIVQLATAPLMDNASDPYHLDLIVATDESDPGTAQEPHYNLYLFERRDASAEEGLIYVNNHQELNRAAFITSHIPDDDVPGEFTPASIVSIAAGDVDGPSDPDGNGKKELILAMNPVDPQDYRCAIVTYDIELMPPDPEESASFALGEKMEDYSFVIEDCRLIQIACENFFNPWFGQNTDDLMAAFESDASLPPEEHKNIRFYYSLQHVGRNSNKNAGFIELENAAISLHDLPVYEMGHQITEIALGPLYNYSYYTDFIAASDEVIYFFRNTGDFSAPPLLHGYADLGFRTLDIQVAPFFIPVFDPAFDVFILTETDDPELKNFYAFFNLAGITILPQFRYLLPNSPSCFEIGFLDAMTGDLPSDMIAGYAGTSSRSDKCSSEKNACRVSLHKGIMDERLQ